MDDHGNVTIPSLREWLGGPAVGSEVIDGEEIDLLAKQLAEEDDEHRLIEGMSRPKVEGFALRQERLVDEYQDEIYRLPINTQLFLSGPPGTGKTTTLIRRLGQKVDLSEGSLSESERSAIESAGPLSEHARSWMMFSPTELLKQSVAQRDPIIIMLSTTLGLARADVVDLVDEQDRRRFGGGQLECRRHPFEDVTKIPRLQPMRDRRYQ